MTSIKFTFNVCPSTARGTPIRQICIIRLISTGQMLLIVNDMDPG